jgi:hypothetical protein
MIVSSFVNYLTTLRELSIGATQVKRFLIGSIAAGYAQLGR